MYRFPRLLRPSRLRSTQIVFFFCSIDWSPNNSYIATGSGDNSICLLTAKRDDSGSLTLAISGRVSEAHAADVNCVRSVSIKSLNMICCYLADVALLALCRWNPSPESSDVLVSVGDDGLVKLWALVL